MGLLRITEVHKMGGLRHVLKRSLSCVAIQARKREGGEEEGTSEKETRKKELKKNKGENRSLSAHGRDSPGSALRRLLGPQDRTRHHPEQLRETPGDRPAQGLLLGLSLAGGASRPPPRSPRPSLRGRLPERQRPAMAAGRREGA